ncbi:glycosyl hydrolase 53 family protein [Candidatus Pacearchaeota archaeon]|nr:glycosyl hydrolase 53 family protein [Candidatus Pacearchaeota archaeon]
MKKRWWIAIIFVVLILFLLMIPQNEKSSEPQNSYVDDTTLLPSVELGDNVLLGITVTETSSVDFSEAFSAAKEAGLEIVGLPLAWDEIETKKGEYGNVFLGIANDFYSSEDMKLFLVISPINTNQLRVPDYLEGKNFDDEEVIEAFNSMMNYVIESLDKVEVVSVSIGNEIDIYLGSEEDWAQYETFLIETSRHLESKGIKVGSKATLNGLVEKNIEELRSINENLDIVMVTYYPIHDDFGVQDTSVVSEDLGRLLSTYPGEIQILEAGYPTSPTLGSSEIKQANFISELFSFANSNSRITVINIEWLHDKSTKEVNDFAKYYGLSDSRFKEYLRTLGLRTNSGEDKEALRVMRRF